MRQSDIRASNANKLAQYRHEMTQWRDKKSNAEVSHARKIAEFRERKTNYPMIFRYFKQATFSVYSWPFSIPAEDLSVLYLAYILFHVNRKIGVGIQYSLQMGIPTGADELTKRKRYATGILIQAIRLVEDVFDNDLDAFLATPIEELLVCIPNYEYSDELKFRYGIMILPEAYAALRSLTYNARIPDGISMMLDIGGGTTDISFLAYSQRDCEPEIFHFCSVPKGLNFFLEYGATEKNDHLNQMNLDSIPVSLFNDAHAEYTLDVRKVVSWLTQQLLADLKMNNIPKSIFFNSIANRPIIYTGGGSSDSR